MLRYKKDVPRGTSFFILSVIQMWKEENYLPKYTSRTEISEGDTPDILEA